MNELNLVEKNLDFVESEKSSYFQVDFLKAIMIFLVIFDHMVSWDIKGEIGVTLWERISIPVFLVIMGFNMGCSFRRKERTKLKELYSWNYFKKKILRYIVPFLILYAVSTFIGLFMYGFDITAMWNGQYYPQHGFIHLFFGFLPFWGPGNWFLPILFQSILILPLIYWAFIKKPTLTLILCFVVEIVLQLILFFFIGDITTWEESYLVLIFMTSILFYLPAVGLGIWFSYGYKLDENRNFFMWFLYPISLAFIIVHQFFFYRIRFNGVPLLRGDYHFLIIPYSAFLFLLAMKFLPQKSDRRISRGISLISKSTYHILLTQILGYGMIVAFWGTHYGVDAPFTPDEILDLVAAWILFISFGILWYKIGLQKNLIRRIMYYINFFIVFASLLLLTFWIQGFWVPIPLIIIIIYAILALIIKFVVKRPHNIKILGFWTLFLLITFIMMILQVEVFQPNYQWIAFIPIGTFLIYAIIATILYSTTKK